MKMELFMNLIQDNDYYSTDRFFSLRRLAERLGGASWK